MFVKNKKKRKGEFSERARFFSFMKHFSKLGENLFRIYIVYK